MLSSTLLLPLLVLSLPPAHRAVPEGTSFDVTAEIEYGRTCLDEAVRQNERLAIGEAVQCLDSALCYDAYEHGTGALSFVACLEEHAARRQRVAEAQAQFDAPAAAMELTPQDFWRTYGVTPSKMAGVYIQASRRAACWRDQDYRCLFFAKLEKGRYGIDYMLPDIEVNHGISRVLGQLRYAIEPL